MHPAMRQFISGARTSWGLYLANLRPVILFGATIPRVLFQALFFTLLAQSAGGEELGRFALIGNAMHTAAFMNIIFITAVIQSEKWNGTLPFIMAAPTSWLPSMLGRSVAEYTHAIFNSLLILFVFVPFLAPEISLLNLTRAMPIFLLTLASVSTLGWLVGAISLPVRWGAIIANVVGYTMMLVCGVNFPLEALPTSVQFVAQLIPMTNGVLAIREVIEGASYISVLTLMGKELLIGFVFGVIAWQTFQYRLRVTRETGAFELL